MLAELIQFLSELKENNNRAWFELNRDRYKKLNLQFQDLVTDLIVKIGEFDQPIQLLSPKDCTFRINRDTRFSNNKSPYKTNISAAFSPYAKDPGQPSYYFQIDSNGSCIIGGGEYMPESPRLFLIRTVLAKDSTQFKKIINNRDFKKMFGELSGDKLITTPKGFDKNHPDIVLLRLKNYITFRNLDNIKDWDNAKFVRTATKVFETLSPLVVYLRNIEVD